MAYFDAVPSSWKRASTIGSIAICLSIIVPIGRSKGLQDVSRSPELPSERAVSVKDAIQMTQFGEFSYMRGVSAKYSPARFSPDGQQFAILTAKGDLEHNTNDYSILLFQTTTALQSTLPRVLVSFSSSSNRPAIQDIRWVDNRTVSFLGENPGEMQQAYEIDCETRRLKKLTNATTNLVSYAISPNGDRIFFLAERPPDPLFDGRAAREGVVISTQPLPDLLLNESRILGSQVADLFVETRKGMQETPVRVQGNFASWSPLWLSPNGQYLILEGFVGDIPEIWNDYEDRAVKRRLRSDSLNRGQHPIITRYELINIDSGQIEPLLDAPSGETCVERAVMWSHDSNSVVVAGTYLPLGVPDLITRKLWASRKMAAEIKIPTLEIVPITSKEICPLSLDLKSGRLLTGLTSFVTPATVSYDRLVAFQKSEDRWEEVNVTTSHIEQNDWIEVTLDEDMNTAPKLFATDIHTGRRALLLDLNPQFRYLRFGQVQNVSFKATDGHDVKAGLYLPPDYKQGRKYPLVIQTHGWDPQRFWIDGPWTTAFAAQPLAGRGFVILQMDEDLSRLSTPDEAPREASAYEGGIDFLDSLGIIDRDRVGIVAFSRTGLGVTYALTHSKYHFAAANIADAGDLGYFAYLSIAIWLPHQWPDYESVNGGSPFGTDLTFWLNNSGFNLTRVTTPIREESHGMFGILGAWQWFVGLSRLDKPVELIHIPNGEHVLVKPWERFVSQQGSVDWFSFWLQNYEDPEPAKAKQYVRWRELRKLQQIRVKGNTIE
jgi:hypothetical protein